MKKIGLAVCYDTKNFGSQLQVLATVKKIDDLGYETEIIRYKKKLTPVFLMQSIPRVFNVPFLISGLFFDIILYFILSIFAYISKNIGVGNAIDVCCFM